MFVAALQAEGVSREQIQMMGREVPGALLNGLEAHGKKGDNGGARGID